MDTKPGYRTTEFWLSAAATIIALLYGSGAIAPEGTGTLEKVVAFVAAALAAIGYSAARGKTKEAASLAAAAKNGGPGS